MGNIAAHGGADDSTLVQEFFAGPPVPVRRIPGNHDIGDNPAPRSGEPLDPSPLALFRATPGPDRWSLALGG